MAIGSLDSALAGLRIAQQQLNIISTNVSNVGTPGFTRKILPQSTVAIDGTAVGVRADTLIRKVDMNLSRDLWTQVSGTSALSVKADYMDQIQKCHGAPEKKLSVAAEIARRYDKNFILELYLNEIFFGNQSYGVESAAQFYFHHSAADLTLPEAAMLAGLI